MVWWEGPQKGSIGPEREQPAKPRSTQRWPKEWDEAGTCHMTGDASWGKLGFDNPTMK